MQWTCVLAGVLALVSHVAAFQLVANPVGLAKASLALRCGQHSFSKPSVGCRFLSPVPRMRTGPIALRGMAGTNGVVDDVRAAFESGLKQMNDQAKMDVALSDLVTKASDAYAVGVR